MSISVRYRQIFEQIETEADRLYEALPEDTASALRLVDMAAEELQDLIESVGEISQYKLEEKLSPVLLKAHGLLDRARVMLEDADHEKAASVVWELEQLIYRLLNDL
ncbi:MAG TPA: hypothetical protein VIR78_04835 [Malonomonas sp.]